MIILLTTFDTGHAWWHLYAIWLGLCIFSAAGACYRSADRIPGRDVVERQQLVAAQVGRLVNGRHEVVAARKW